MIDIMRSRGVFDPAKFREDIHIYGVGATGSHVVKQLVLHGVPGSQIHVYDFDVVEGHNLANTVYTNEHVGMPKVEALQKLIAESYDEHIKIHNEKVEDAGQYEGVHFLLIDGDRGPLFKSLKFKINVKVLIETGLDARAGRCTIMSPSNINHIKYFEKKYLSNEGGEDPGEVSVCGTRQVVAGTVAMLSSIAVWDFMKWVNDSSHIGYDSFFSTQPLYTEVNKM